MEKDKKFVRRMKKWHKGFSKFMKTNNSNDALLLEKELEKMAPIFEDYLQD